MQKGILKIRQTRKGREYLVEYVNARGKTIQTAIMPQNRHFDQATAVDNDPLEFELLNGVPVKCVVPGKETAPVARAAPAGRQNLEAAQGYRSAPANAQGRALVDAVAPYNFVPFDAAAVLPAFEDEEGIWSGTITCSLKALTPLLVCARPEKGSETAPGICRFMQANGGNIIPGTSIKGMFRALLEILSFSNMEQVSARHLFWRTVDRPAYREFFSGEEILGGYLRKSGAEYTLVPVRVTPREAGAPRVKGCERVETGGLFKNGKKSRDYDFHEPPADVKGQPLPAEIVNTFWAQLTPNQESPRRWAKARREERLKTAPGLPVFYRVDERGEVAELGFCRYFRLKYKYSAHELAYPDGVRVPCDFVTRLFGSAGNGLDGSAFRGRVTVEAARIQGAPYRENGLEAVLGGPKPTCLPLYLEQDASRVKTIAKGRKNNLEYMKNYNDRDARLRGRKLYWHHDVDESFFPGRETMNKRDGTKNNKVITRLFPLDTGAEARIVIHVERLTATELGGLFEAIQLPAGHAHKLGMGKSLGLGSVRLEIVDAAVFDARKLHGSLVERLGQAPASLSVEKIAELRKGFRNRILAAVRERCRKWRDIGEYDELPPIRALRILMDYQNRPKPAQVRTMTLRHIQGDPLTQVNFGNHAILPAPEEVIRNGSAQGS
ncbi:MAG: TIGR03986 family CRISPR-associated RAMP protein [Desulfovibrio sp.]|nr:TIGR03986 family CRISPR-associated RAMP protein [Desulfovibrio sp.]